MSFIELSQEIAKLQTDLNSARLQEFEAQEQITLLTTQLDEERTMRQKGITFHKKDVSFVEDTTMFMYNTTLSIILRDFFEHRSYDKKFFKTNFISFHDIIRSHKIINSIRKSIIQLKISIL